MRFSSKVMPGPFDLLAVLLFLAAIVQGYTSFGDPGIYWHLQTGKIIFANSALPNSDIFLNPTPTNLWICDQWLSDIILYSIYNFGGWFGLSVITLIFLIGAYVYKLSQIICLYTNSLLIALFVTILAVLTSFIQWFSRPVIISFFLTACIYYYALEWANAKFTKKESSTFIVFMAFLFLLWVNLHPAFVLGLMILTIFSLQKIVTAADKLNATLSSLVLLITCLLATLINPFGIGIYRQIFGLVSSDFFMKLNMEWKSPDFQSPVFWFFMLSFIIILVAAMLQKLKQLQLGELLCFIVFLTYSFMHSRYIPFYAIVMAPLLTRSLSGLAEYLSSNHRFMILSRVINKPHWNGSKSLYFSLVSIMILFVSYYVPNKYQPPGSVFSKFPIKALAAIEKENHHKPANIFHTPDWGGAITFFNWPPLSPFIDDRNSLIGKERYEDFLKLNGLDDGWRDTITKYNFTYFLLEPKSGLAKYLKESKEYPKLYEDSVAVVYKRN